jgi:hypothetical protein
LRTTTVAAIKLLARGFFIVHDALASDNYSPEDWLLLSPELPQLGMWRDWDRCKKLRRAVRYCSSEHKPSIIKALLESASSPEHLALAQRLFR